MLIALLATMGRCASADLCPSDTELMFAIRQRDDEATLQIGSQFRAETPDNFTMVHMERIVRISQVHCGEALPDDPRAMNCAYRVHYPTHVRLEIARLKRANGRWIIRDGRSVTVRRRQSR